MDAAVYWPTLIGTDIFVLPLAENKTAIAFLQPDNTIALSVSNATRVTYNNRAAATNLNETSQSTILPFGYFSATSLISNSTLIYFYYQLNDTFMGEITYNTIEGTWASEPAHISVF